MNGNPSPAIGDHVGYVHDTDGTLETRLAVVIGYWHDDELHLAVLDQDGANLDSMSMGVPHLATADQHGTWHRLHSGSHSKDDPDPSRWPTIDDTQIMPTVPAE